MPRKEFVKAALGDVGDPGERIDVVEARGTEEAEHHRSALAPTIRADEQPGFSAPGRIYPLNPA